MAARARGHTAAQRAAAQRELGRRGTDFVAREQGAVAVEPGIFEGLGRQGRGELLQAPQRQTVRRVRHASVESQAERGQQRLLGRVEVGVGAGLRRLAPGLVGGLAGAAFGIGAVDGKAGQPLREHRVDGGRRGAQFGQVGQAARQRAPLGAEVAPQQP
ncbi:Uncharacterised protein [Bordetella pertussis]|nr:Uncharacterised protein [Bordetella pertussis]